MRSRVVSDGTQQQHELIVTASKVDSLQVALGAYLANTLQASPYIYKAAAVQSINLHSHNSEEN